MDAGFAAVEIHAAHGYLLHEFLSPLTNHRTDGYGGDRAGRMRLALEVARAVRAAVGEDVPVLTRISATDWVDGGWTVDDSVRARRRAGRAPAWTWSTPPPAAPSARRGIPVGPGYQVPLAARIRREAGVPTGAVGLIVEPEQAERDRRRRRGRPGAARPGAAARPVLAAPRRREARRRAALAPPSTPAP